MAEAIGRPLVAAIFRRNATPICPRGGGRMEPSAGERVISNMGSPKRAGGGRETVDQLERAPPRRAIQSAAGRLLLTYSPLARTRPTWPERMRRATEIRPQPRPSCL